MTRRSFILMAIGSAALPLVHESIEPEDSHRNLRYRLWKQGWFPFREGFTGAFMNDAARDSLVIGRTREELAERFGPLTEGRKNEVWWGHVYERFQPDDRFVWLWRSNWLVVLRDNRAIELNYPKG